MAAAKLNRGRPGPIERNVRAEVKTLLTAHPFGDSLSEMAFTLARTLDQGAGLSTAAVNRELRATIDAMVALGAGDGGDLDDELSTAVRDETQS